MPQYIEGRHTRYLLHEQLGQGGFGSVWRATDTQSNTECALKTLDRMDRGQHLVRFKDEFRRTRRLLHPALVMYYSLEPDAVVPFHTMELVQGRDLLTATELRWSGSLPATAQSNTGPARSMGYMGPGTESLESDLDDGLREHAQARQRAMLEATLQEQLWEPQRPEVWERVRGLLAELVEGIHYFHTRGGLIHCDLKPANVLVTPADQVKILDLGLICYRPALGIPGEVQSAAGTPLYRAPEQLRPGTRSPATDWYALGCILYEMLTGHAPHFGYSLAELARAKQTVIPRPPVQVNPACPADLSALATALLEREEGDRPGYRRDHPGPRQQPPPTHPAGRAPREPVRGAESRAL